MLQRLHILKMGSNEVSHFEFGMLAEEEKMRVNGDVNGQ